MMPWLIAGTALLSWLLSLLLAHPRLGLRILDRPGARSLHERPTPRTGGLAICLALAVGTALATRFAPALWLDPTVVLGALLAAAVSLADDVWGLRARWRLPVHLLAALLLLQGGYGLSGVHLPGGIWLPLGAVGGAVAVLFVVWMTNLYNFMDGIDGLAGGMTAAGFATLGLIGALQGDPGYALAALLVAAAALGFLLANFPPARLFMGDVGAVTLGFLAGAFALGGVRAGLFALWIPILVFSPFIIDATVTLIRRAQRRERVWQAHRSHYYQRLVLTGWSHRKTALASYVMMLGTGLTAVLLTIWPHPAGALAASLGWAAAYAAIAFLIARRERRYRPPVP